MSETYNPAKNRFDTRRGARNEPLDTWVYAYAAAHHPELRLHRRTRADWDAAAKRLAGAVPAINIDKTDHSAQPVSANSYQNNSDDVAPAGSPAKPLPSAMARPSATRKPLSRNW